MLDILIGSCIKMHEVRKINGRLVIARDGEVVYGMPWWVRVGNRDDLRWLSERFDLANGPDISAIMEFETRHSTVGRNW